MSASLQTDPSLAEGRALEKWVDSGGVATSDDPESKYGEGEDMYISRMLIYWLIGIFTSYPSRQCLIHPPA